MAFLSKFTDWFRSSQQATPPSPEAKPKIDWQQRQEDLGKFVYEDDGFTYAFDDGTQKFLWTEIERISGYKADRYAYDEICMDIEWKGRTWTLSEETPGWYQLLRRLAVAFPSMPKHWDLNIIQPPFARNYTILYEREDRITLGYTNFYCALRSTDLSWVVSIFKESEWSVRKAGRSEWELISYWARLNLQPHHDELLLVGEVSFHPNNITELDQLLDKVGVYYHYEYYDEQKKLQLAVPK